MGRLPLAIFRGHIDPRAGARGAGSGLGFRRIVMA